MALVKMIKLRRNGWPEDEPMTEIEESRLDYSEHVIDNEDERTIIREWRLEGRIVKSGAHVTLKKNVAGEALAAIFQ